MKGVTFMKMKKLAAAALTAMLATSSLSLSAFAEAEESSFEKRSVKAYLFSMDESRFYDLDLIKKYMDEYYGVAPAEESKPDSQSENKPADNNNNKSDQSNPATGTAASLSLVAAAVGALIFIRKKNR